jgi:hypothetical protein
MDQNGARMPTAPLVPLFKAVDYMSTIDANHVPVDWPSVDLVTDRNGLRKLLRWVVSNGRRTKDWRIDVQLAGTKTMIFSRRETSAKRVADGSSYGKSFEKMFSTPAPGCEKSSGHHRIISFVSLLPKISSF